MLLVLIVNIHVLDGTEKTTIIEIQDNEEVSVLKQMIQFESEITPSEQIITFNGNTIKDSGLISQSGLILLIMFMLNTLSKCSTLSQYIILGSQNFIIIILIGLENNANIIVKQIVNRGYTQQRIDPNIAPEALIELAKSQPQLIQDILDSDPEFGAAIRECDIVKVRTMMMKRQLKRHEQGFKRQQEQMQIERDPDNPEHQTKMLEAIRQENVQQNMNLAYDELPESFGTIHMLYINVTINDTPIKAFVDSGAQSTIMSAACAERVGIMRLLDTRYAGMARGVGTAKILGEEWEDYCYNE
jgi:DNA damage-inducible protein 1